MRILYIIFIVALLPILSFGQRGYFSTDSLTSVGVKLIDSGDLINSQFCQVKKGDKVVRYTPHEVKEYGFADGRVYVSMEIHIADSSKRVFLERLHKEKTNLYYYKGNKVKTFFIQKDSVLFIEIPKQNTKGEDFSKQLLFITKDCPSTLDACRLVNYSKKSLSKFISRYNKCEEKPFPHFKYGILVGYEFSKLVLSDEIYEELNYFDYKYDGGFSIGIFIDNPILVSDFSLHTEFLFSKHGYSYNKLIDSEDMDFVANLSSLNIPLLLRYAYPSNAIRPFINVGINGSYFFENETRFRKVLINGTTIEINDNEITPTANNFNFGYAIGGGVECNLNFKNSLFFELRYINQRDFKFLGTKGFSVQTGVNF